MSSFEKGGKIGILICQWWIVRRLQSDASFRVNVFGITKGVWCWNFGFTMFGFREKSEPHFWLYCWSPAPRHCCKQRQWTCPRKHPYPWKHPLTTNGRGEQLKILRNNIPDEIKQFTQHQWWFKELFSWGSNEDD